MFRLLFTIVTFSLLTSRCFSQVIIEEVGVNPAPPVQVVTVVQVVEQPKILPNILPTLRANLPGIPVLRPKIITMYTADWCSACKVWEATNWKTFKANGFTIKKVNIMPPMSIRVNSSNITITSIPFFVVEYEGSKQWFSGSNFTFRDFLKKKLNR